MEQDIRNRRSTSEEPQQKKRRSIHEMSNIERVSIGWGQALTERNNQASETPTSTQGESGITEGICTCPEISFNRHLFNPFL